MMYAFVLIGLTVDFQIYHLIDLDRLSSVLHYIYVEDVIKAILRSDPQSREMILFQ